MVVMTETDAITPDLLPAEVVRPSGPDMTAPALSGVAIDPLWRQERRIIEQALGAHDGNVARAAAALEIAPSTIHRKRQAWQTRSGAA